MKQPTVVIIGAGHAGHQLAAALRELRYEGRVVLVGDEPHAPYQRPPLSKAYLLGETEIARLALSSDKFYVDRSIELIQGKRAVSIDRGRRSVALDDGSAIEYDHLVLATGARNRPLPIPGTDLDGVFYLRTLAEASALKARLAAAKNAVVIGAGFIGLEFAASAVKLGLDVTVIDVADRPMARALSKKMSSVFTREHTNLGVHLLFNTNVTCMRGEAGRVVGVETADGRVLPADLVMIGIGVIPNVELASACGLEVDNGIVVDEFLHTSDPLISAIGDVVSHPNPYGHAVRTRLESVQNASDQARCVAAGIVGKSAAYDAVPWFWSHQAHLRLQMAGLPGVGCGEILRGDEKGQAFSIFLFRDRKLVCVESLNKPADHMLARKLLGQKIVVTPEQVADEQFDLKGLLSKPPVDASRTM